MSDKLEFALIATSGGVFVVCIFLAAACLTYMLRGGK